MRKQKHPDWAKFLNCDDCVKRMSKPFRATWKCGLVPGDHEGQRGWIPPMGAWPAGHDECPGRLIRLTQVMETAEARIWFEKSSLGAYYEGEELTRLVKDTIGILSAEISNVEQDMLIPKDQR